MQDSQDKTTPPALSDTPPSYEELMARARAGLGKKGPGQPSTAPQGPEPEHPVQGFWDRLVNGQNDGKSRVHEIVRSVGRGALNAVTEAGDTVAEGAAYVDRKTGLGEKLQPGFNAAYDDSKGKLGKGTFTQNADGEGVSDHYLGKRSDDVLASFAESATQFTAGFAASGELKALKGLKGGAHVLGALARGAVVDATMFDPYEAQLAELAAKAPVPVMPIVKQLVEGVKGVGSALSVGQDDGAVVARLKRAAAGLIPAATIEGIIAGSRALRAVGTITSPTATEAEKTAAHAALEEHVATMQAVEDGTHVPEGAHVTVKPTEDGHFTIEKVGDTSALEGAEGKASPVFEDRGEALMQAESMNMGLDARATVGQVNEEAASTLTEAVATPEGVEKLAASPEQVDGLAGSYHNSADEDAKIVSDIAQRIHEALPGIRQGDNTLADASLRNLAEQMLGYVPEDRALQVVGQLHGSDGLIQSTTKIMAEIVAGAKGRQLAKMSEMVDARPHDPVVMGEAVQAVQNYFEFMHRFGMVESDAARMLRLAQQRDAIRAAEVPIGRRIQEKLAPGLAKDLRGAKRAAETDALTGVANNAALEKALPAAEADPNTHALFFDANNFGQINKVAGHAAGDQAIKDMAIAIKRAAAENGVGERVFRKGGDEFAVLAPKDKADAIRARAEQLYGEKTHAGQKGETVTSSISGSKGNTLAEADSGLQVSKAKTKAATTTKQAIKDVSEAIDKIGKNTTDTKAVSAADFSLARARQQVETALKKIEEGDKSFSHDPELATARAKEIKEGADAQRANPISLSPEEAAAAKATKTSTSNPIERLSTLLDGAERKLDAEIEKAGLPPRAKGKAETTPIQDRLADVRRQAREEPNKLRAGKGSVDGLEQSGEGVTLQGAVPAEGEVQLQDLSKEADSIFKELQGDREVSPDALSALSPAERAKRIGLTSAQDTPEVQNVAGMKARDASRAMVDEANVAATLRMIKMAGGDPRNASAIIRAMEVQKLNSNWGKVYEFFANSLLSGIKTSETILGSGLGVTVTEPLYRMAAGAVTGNRQLAQEGLDIFMGNFAYLGDNLRSAAAAWRLKRPILDPIPPRHYIGGLTGEIVRTPGRAVGMLDEFLTATNYRSYVRAKSMRLAREQGLDGAALQARVAQDLKASFDPQTGIATIPEALKYAEVPSFKQPLGPGFGKAWQNMANESLAAKFVTPFVKAPMNIWNYVLDSTPGLNYVLSSKNRAIIQAGGEEAAMLHVRSAFATTVYGYAMFAASQGQITGKGPSDPELRKMWEDEQHNQPYSIKIGGKWISYRRMDPFGFPLGLIADLHTFLQERDQVDENGEHYVMATIASIAQNMVSRSYMSGLAELMDAVSSSNANKVSRYVGGFLGNVVPQGVASMNPDPYYREVRGVLDQVISRIPGYSETLPPRYNAFGEKSLKAQGVLNRGANMFQATDAKHTVADDLVDLKRALPAFSQKLEGRIDLSDKSFGNGKQPSPYERIMQLVRAPEDGRPPLRTALEELVKSPKYQMASGGATMFPGGARWILASTLKDSYEQRALKQVLTEYPKLKSQYEAVARMKGAAIISGESGVQQVESLFGTSRSAH